MVRHSAAGHIQHAIIVAGDSDFIPALEATKESGATVTLWYGEENTIHKDLIDLADNSHEINLRKMPGKKIKVPKKKEQPKQMQGKQQHQKQQSRQRNYRNWT